MVGLVVAALAFLQTAGMMIIVCFFIGLLFDSAEARSGALVGQ